MKTTGGLRNISEEFLREREIVSTTGESVCRRYTA